MEEMNRRPIWGWTASWVLINDLRQPSCRIVGKAAMVVMQQEFVKVGVEFWRGPAELPPSLNLARRDSSPPLLSLSRIRVLLLSKAGCFVSNTLL